MAVVLGVSAYYHDAAAALVVDGQVVAAMQEERLSRRKNDPALPIAAARACLAHAGLTAADVDAVAYYEDPFRKLERVLVSLLRTFPRSLRQFPRAIGAQLGDKLWVLDHLSERLGVPRDRVGTTRHHESHAASAFFSSPYARAAVVTVDGVGEDQTTGIWLGEDRAVRPLAAVEYPHSLGLLYAALTAYLGFPVNEGEYKVMGLAAFGTPRYADELARLVMPAADGSFALGLPYFAFQTDTELGFHPRLERLLGPRRAPGAPWHLESSAEDRRYADVAASLQRATEDALLGVAREAKRLTGADALCLAGGVALNCVANARLLREAGFREMFVQPAAGDAGGALGAAILRALELGDPRPAPMATAALGAPVSNDAAIALAEQLGLPFSTPDDPLAEAAAIVARGEVLALARGRFEWGPRALGQRSILAAPGSADMRDRLNRVVKRRERFRPFAPAVLRERAGEWFTGHDNDMAPFMTTVGAVRPARAAELGAITHVDGSARVQTVTAASAPDLHAILEHLDRATGLPVCLNTSLNGNGEPIVAGEAEALGFFATHAVDALLLGDVLLRKPRGADA